MMKSLIDSCEQDSDVKDDELVKIREEYEMQKQVDKLLKVRKGKKHWY